MGRFGPASARSAEASCTRLGVLGGTFNPPHVGHLALARHAREELGLGRVLLMPARLSPGKAAEDDPGAAHRLEMCRLAATGAEGVDACALEIERDGPSYTVDTLRALHAEHNDIDITFILGADVARTLESWHEFQELPALAQFAVALRPGNGPEEVRRAVALLSAQSGQPYPGLQPSGLPMGFLSMPEIDVSSSEVREWIRKGKPVDGLVGNAVAAYIAQHGLYRAPPEVPAP